MLYQLSYWVRWRRILSLLSIYLWWNLFDVSKWKIHWPTRNWAWDLPFTSWMLYQLSYWVRWGRILSLFMMNLFDVFVCLFILNQFVSSFLISSWTGGMAYPIISRRKVSSLAYSWVSTHLGKKNKMRNSPIIHFIQVCAVT